MVQRYDAPPEPTFTGDETLLAEIATARGPIVVRLRPDLAPRTAGSFSFLANEGYYDGSAFHRVIPGFIAQAGDPTGTGRGTPGYRLEDEPSDEPFVVGSVGMANAGPGTAGSQFFVTLADARHLDGRYTLFGHIEEGLALLTSLARRERSDEPPGALRIDQIRVAEHPG